jgi:hypothetical protein
MSRTRDIVIPELIDKHMWLYGEHVLLDWAGQDEELMTKITPLLSYLQWESQTTIWLWLRRQAADFVVKHGREFKADAQTYKGRRMMEQRCFRNAALKALRNESLTYVEGFVRIVTPADDGVRLIFPFRHAWLIDSGGKVIDPTLRQNGETREINYYGVPFNAGFLRQFTIQSKTYGLLSGMSLESQALLFGQTEGWGVPPR